MVAAPAPLPPPGYRALYQKISAGALRNFGRHDCAGMAAAVAYHFIFSFFAGFFFLACLATQFGRSQENLTWILGVLKNFLPPAGVKLAEDNLARFLQPVSREALPLALALSLWTASNVVEMVMRALNRIYSVAETRPWWQTRLGSLLIVALGALLFILGFNLSVFERQTVSGLDVLLHYRTIIPDLLHSLQWPITWLTSIGSAFFIYFLAPNFQRSQRRTALPGAVFFAIGWQVLNQAFNSYVNHFADFDRIYGPLGTSMAVLMWVYLSSLILLIGGEINAQVARHWPHPPSRRGRRRPGAKSPSDEEAAVAAP